MHTVVVFLITVLGISLAQITSVENPDGSYTIGLSSSGQGNTGDAVLGLLSQSAGWTETSVKHSQLGASVAPNNQEMETRMRQSVQHLVQRFLMMLKENPDIINVFQRLFSVISDYLGYVFNTSDMSINRWYFRRFGRH